MRARMLQMQGLFPYLTEITAATVVSGNLVIAKPAAALPGDLLVGLMAGQAGFAWSGDTGWTERYDYGDVGGQPALRAATRVVDGSEGANFTFTDGVGQASGLILCIRRGAWDVIGGAANGYGTALSPSQITMAGGLVFLAAFAAEASPNFSTPAGMSQLAVLAGSASIPAYALFGQTRTGGAVQPGTTVPAARTMAGLTFSIKAA